MNAHDRDIADHADQESLYSRDRNFDLPAVAFLMKVALSPTISAAVVVIAAGGQIAAPISAAALIDPNCQNLP
jgi:hypothetical protein